MTNHQQALTNLQLTGQNDNHIYYFSSGIGIHKEMKAGWLSMQTAAEKAGLNLAIASGYRSSERKLLIWNNKFTGQNPIKNLAGERVDLSNLSDKEKVIAILLYSALPGASRHHWGTDIDIYATNLLPQNQHLQLEPWEYEPDGPFATLTLWLNAHCHEFGFYFPYDEYRNGIANEPWHLSYAPLALSYQQQLTLPLLEQTLGCFNIHGRTSILELLPHIHQQFINNVNEGIIPTK